MMYNLLYLYEDLRHYESSVIFMKFVNDVEGITQKSKTNWCDSNYNISKLLIYIKIIQLFFEKVLHIR